MSEKNEIENVIDALESGSSGHINASRVKELFLSCLTGKNIVEVEGIFNIYGLDKTILEENQDEITTMLNELPDEFKQSSGGGWTFLNACNDRECNQWTGLHERVEQLFMLGMGLDIVSYLMPREMWEILPGGMPYLVIKL